MYWKVREWILGGGKLVRDDDWYQLTHVKYRKKLEGMRCKLQIMPKEQKLKLGIESPDVADALSLTFATPDIVASSSEVIRPDNNHEFDAGGIVTI